MDSIMSSVFEIGSRQLEAPYEIFEHLGLFFSLNKYFFFLSMSEVIVQRVTDEL